MVGNLKTRRWVIDRELTFNEGEPISTSKFQESRRNLYDLGIFRTADVRVAPSEPGTEMSSCRWWSESSPICPTGCATTS